MRPREFVQTHGSTAFRSLESNALKDFLESEQDEWILATGGGVVDSPEALQLLRSARRAGVLIAFLDGTAERLYKRVIKKGIPAILDTNAPYRSYLQLYFARAPRYRQVADLCIVLAGLESADVAARLVTAIGEYFDVGK